MSRSPIGALSAAPLFVTRPPQVPPAIPQTLFLKWRHLSSAQRVPFLEAREVKTVFMTLLPLLPVATLKPFGKIQLYALLPYPTTILLSSLVLVTPLGKCPSTLLVNARKKLVSVELETVTLTLRAASPVSALDTRPVTPIALTLLEVPSYGGPFAETPLYPSRVPPTLLDETRLILNLPLTLESPPTNKPSNSSNRCAKKPTLYYCSPHHLP